MEPGLIHLWMSTVRLESLALAYLTLVKRSLLTIMTLYLYLAFLVLILVIDAHSSQTDDLCHILILAQLHPEDFPVQCRKSSQRSSISKMRLLLS